jgi:2-methylisocitrate lyase-like PEP mutase family enzyme
MATASIVDWKTGCGNCRLAATKSLSGHHHMSADYHKARTFHELHTREGCFLMPNAWDIGSARLLAAAGFAALATTSAGIAFSLGRPDHLFCAEAARLTRDPMLARIAAIAASVELPLNADLEAGYGSTAEDVGTTIRLAIESGAAGGNIEDYSGERSKPLLDVDVACERIRAARAAIHASGIPFVLVARTDPYLVEHPEPFAEAVRRANLYRAAGADCLFIPGPADAATIGALVEEVQGPLSVVVGLTGHGLRVAELAALGVRRISIGASLARSVYRRIWEAAQEMATRGTFSYADSQLPQGDLNRIFESTVRVP